MEMVTNNLVWILLGGALLLGVAYFILQKNYWLENWVKYLFGALILGSVFGAVSVGFFLSPDSPSLKVGSFNKENGGIIDKAVEEVDTQIAQEEKFKQKTIEQADEIEGEITKLIEADVNNERAELLAKIDSVKRKRHDTFVYDSLMLKLEAFELMVASRKQFLHKDLDAYKSGMLDLPTFEQKLLTYQKDIDSLKMRFQIASN